MRIKNDIKHNYNSHNLQNIAKTMAHKGTLYLQKTLGDPISLQVPEDMGEKDVLEAVEDDIFLINQNNPKGVSRFSRRATELLEKAYANKSPKVLKMYTKHQNKWFDFMKRNNVEDFMDQDAMVAFFHEMAQEYRPSTLWVIYSCINSWYSIEKNVNLKSMKALRKFLKSKTEHYVGTKAAVFSPEEIHKMVRYYGNSDLPRSQLCAVTILISYYGLLRMNDVLKVKARDVSFNEKENCWEVKFDYQRKRRNEGMTYLIPPCYNKIMSRYIDQLADWDPKSNKPEPRFLRNMHAHSGTRIQNAGPSNLSKFASEMAYEILKEDPSRYTSHSWRRSAATNLADAGLSMIDLKRAGQWKSDSVVEGYISNSRPLRMQKMNLLLPSHKRELQVGDTMVVPLKGESLDPDALSVKKEAALPDAPRSAEKKKIPKLEDDDEDKKPVAVPSPSGTHYSNCTIVIHNGSTGASAIDDVATV